MKFISSIYLLLLGYIIIALVFWGFSLHRQSVHIFEQEITILQSRVDSVKQTAEYIERKNAIEHSLKMRSFQYIGEGTTFLCVILIGAAVVFTSFRRRINLSKQQNNFMLSVTHELKTPIAAIKLNLQTLEKYQLDENKKYLLISRSVKEADRLNDLCNNMLYASRIEGKQYKPARESLDLSAVVMGCANDFMLRYPDRYETDIKENCRTSGDKMMLQIAVNNLLDNAMKYSPQDKKIQVVLSETGETAKIEVKDLGAGIPDVEKKNIFRKFYRIGSEENRKAKGTGLGLYLTSKIIQQHGGLLTVKDNTPNGAIFEMLLPIE